MKNLIIFAIVSLGIINFSFADDKLPFEEARLSGDTLYITGQYAGVTKGEDGKIVKGSVYEQTKATMEIIDKLLKQYNFSKANIVNCTIQLSNLSHKPEMNKAYLEYLEGVLVLPTRTVIAGVQIDDGLDVEIDCRATKGKF